MAAMSPEDDYPDDAGDSVLLMDTRFQNERLRELFSSISIATYFFALICGVGMAFIVAGIVGAFDMVLFLYPAGVLIAYAPLRIFLPRSWLTEFQRTRVLVDEQCLYYREYTRLFSGRDRPLSSWHVVELNDIDEIKAKGRTISLELRPPERSHRILIGNELVHSIEFEGEPSADSASAAIRTAALASETLGPRRRANLGSEPLEPEYDEPYIRVDDLIAWMTVQFADLVVKEKEKRLVIRTKGWGRVADLNFGEEEDGTFILLQWTLGMFCPAFLVPLLAPIIIVPIVLFPDSILPILFLFLTGLAVLIAILVAIPLKNHHDFTEEIMNAVRDEIGRKKLRLFQKELPISFSG